MITKLKTVEEKAGETMDWLELLSSGKSVAKDEAAELGKEASEILAVTAASKKTLRAHSSKW
jgi:hypothetical protein